MFSQPVHVGSAAIIIYLFRPDKQTQEPPVVGEGFEKYFAAHFVMVGSIIVGIPGSLVGLASSWFGGTIGWALTLGAKLCSVWILNRQHLRVHGYAPPYRDNLASFLRVLHLVPQLGFVVYGFWDHLCAEAHAVGSIGYSVSVLLSVGLLVGSVACEVVVEVDKGRDRLLAVTAESKELRGQLKALSESELRLSQNERVLKEKNDRHTSFMLAACTELRNRSESILGAVSLVGDSGLSAEQRAPLELASDSLSTFVRDLSLFTKISDDTIELEGTSLRLIHFISSP